MFGITFCRYFKLNLALCGWLGCIPFRWSEPRGKIQVIRKKRQFLMYRLEVCLNLLYVVAMSIKLGSGKRIVCGEVSRISILYHVYGIAITSVGMESGL